MKKLLLLLPMFAFLTGFAGNVKLETALFVGKNFYYERLSQRQQVSYEQINVRGTFTELVNGQPVFYALNFDIGGWVVVSAEDAVTPVLAYSFAGSYTREDRPPQFTAWMEGYAKQIGYSRIQGLAAPEKVVSEWERLSVPDPSLLNLFPGSRDVAPMLTSTWNQGSPYNFLCPVDPAGSGGHVYAGCVATAMAQVLYYYRWPVTGTGSHCYYPSGYPQQCADFANTTYFWNEMLNSMTGQDTAMALIQWHCGIGVDMMYGAGGSGAYSENAAAALRNYFKCHPNTTLEYKDNYTETAWAALLRDNLDAGRPMYYHGFGSGGHAFNVDGYQGTDYFHFNWGWSGSYNGYYYLNNLNPGGNNFTNGQGAIVNIYPDTLSYTYPPYCTGQTVLSRLEGTFEDGSCPENYQNNSSCNWLLYPQSTSDSVTGIHISFQRFNTEQGNDLVTIYQGGTTSGPVLAQYSGNDIPSSITVGGNQALVTFTSNGSTTRPGWFASYYSETMDWCQGITTLTDPEGAFSDGSFYFDYKNNSVCRWKIVPEGTGAVELSFTAFMTESATDLLQIYDLGTETLLASYSGIYTPPDVPPPVSASSGKMFLIFTTDQETTEAGWEAEYFTYALGAEERDLESAVSVFPNPVSDKLTLRITGIREQFLKADLMDINGKRVLTTGLTIRKGIVEAQLDVSTLPSGIYMLLILGEKEITTRKIVVH
ncbi:MAG: C10 family peptidase [bacterium]